MSLRFDWPGLLRAGRAVGVMPREVWRMTPAEFALLLGRDGGGGPLTRARLEELAAAFPDGTEGDGHGGSGR